LGRLKAGGHALNSNMRGLDFVCQIQEMRKVFVLKHKLEIVVGTADGAAFARRGRAGSRSYRGRRID
jgi:hypothetical protein